MADRREKVILELEDRFSSGMIKAAAATALLDKNLDSLSGSSVQTSRDSEKVRESVKGLGDEFDRTSTKSNSAGKDIDKFSGRLRLLTEAAVVLGPALVPIGAVAVPAIAALAGGLGAAAGAAVLTITAFQGVGDALKTIDAYQIAPTTANLDKMRASLDGMGPAGAEFVRYLDSLDPALKDLQNITREGLFPGMQNGIDDLLTRLPQVRQIVANLSTAMGDLAADAGSALASDRWSAFFDYLETDAAPTLTAFSKSIGNVAEGLGSLLVAFAPLSADFSSGMEDMTKSFADWAAGLSKTDGFKSFVAYVRESGPQVLHLLGALSMAFVDIATAAAPVGRAVLPALTAMAKVLSIIATSPIGPPLFTAVAALLAMSRAAKLVTSSMDRLKVSSETTATGFSKIARTAAGIAAVGMAVGVIADGVGRISAADIGSAFDTLKLGDANATMDDLIGNIEELASSRNKIDLGEIVTVGGVFGDTTLDKYADNVDQLDQKLAELVATGQKALAAKTFARITALAEEQGVAAGDTAKQFDAYAQALKNSDAAGEAAETQKRYNAALNASNRVLGLTRTQVEGLNQAMEEQVTAALGAFDAVTQYRRALADAQKQAKKSDAGINGNSEAANKNRDALSGLAAAWNNQGDSVRNNMTKWRAARGEFIATAKQMGVTGEQARALADKVLAIPKQRQIDIKMTGSEQAASQLERIRSAVMSIPREWSTTYYVNQVNRINKGPVTGPGSTNAYGNFDPSDRANGHAPEFSRRPVTRVWNEPETQGESYIPHANDSRRPRAKSILEQTAGMFNGTVAWHADGGMYSSRSSANLDPLTSSASTASTALTRAAAAADKERKSREKMLQHEIKRDEHELDRDKKATDAARDHVKAVRDDMKSLRDSIAQRYQSQVFGNESTANFAGVGLSAENFRLMNAAPDPLDTLRQDIRDAREARQLYKQLRAEGVHGAALTYAQQNASLGELQALAGDSSYAKQYQNLYGTRQHVTTRAGDVAATQRYGAAAIASEKALTAALAVQHQMQAELKTHTHQLEQIRKENKRNSDDNADRTSKNLDKVGASAKRSR